MKIFLHNKKCVNVWETFEFFAYDISGSQILQGKRGRKKKNICSVRERGPDIFTLAEGVYEISFCINKQPLQRVAGHKQPDLWKLLGGLEKEREKWNEQNFQRGNSC